MNKLISLFIAVLLVGCGANSDDISRSSVAASDDESFKVLIYSRTAGFRHSSIEPGILAIQQIGADNGFEVDATEDPTAFTSENLNQYAAIIWLNTTLDVLDTEEQRQAFEDFIHAGGGYVGVHSAADTHHSWPFYEELVGAHFLSHQLPNTPGTLRIETPEHPTVAHIGDTWNFLMEEYYSFKTNPRGSVRVIANIDEDSYFQRPNTSCDPRGSTFPEGYSGIMGDHPMVWCHDKFAGRSWYTAIGHEAYLYQQADYQQHLLNGILTATKRIEASCEVNEKPEAVPEYVEPVLESCAAHLTPFL